jgi:hypothetical protein
MGLEITEAHRGACATKLCHQTGLRADWLTESAQPEYRIFAARCQANRNAHSPRPTTSNLQYGSEIRGRPTLHPALESRKLQLWARHRTAARPPAHRGGHPRGPYIPTSSPQPRTCPDTTTPCSFASRHPVGGPFFRAGHPVCPEALTAWLIQLIDKPGQVIPGSAQTTIVTTIHDLVGGPLPRTADTAWSGTSLEIGAIAQADYNW